MNGVYHAHTLGSILKWLSFLAIAGILLWYGAFQARLLIAGPSITLNADTTVLHDTRVATIAGTAQNVALITLDDRPIFTDDTGNFHEQLVLENGYTIMTLRAKDQYGREKIVTQPFVYMPAYAHPTQKH